MYSPVDQLRESASFIHSDLRVPEKEAAAWMEEQRQHLTVPARPSADDFLRVTVLIQQLRDSGKIEEMDQKRSELREMQRALKLWGKRKAAIAERTEVARVKVALAMRAAIYSFIEGCGKQIDDLADSCDGCPTEPIRLRIQEIFSLALQADALISRFSTLLSLADTISQPRRRLPVDFVRREYRAEVDEVCGVRPDPLVAAGLRRA